MLWHDGIADRSIQFIITRLKKHTKKKKKKKKKVKRTKPKKYYINT